MASRHTEKIILSDSVRIFMTSENEIRLRIGIFNFDEAVLSLENETPELKKYSRETFLKLGNGGYTTIEELQSSNLSKEDKIKLLNVYNQLKAKGILTDQKEKETNLSIISAIFGSSSVILDNPDFSDKLQKGTGNNKVLLITDSAYIQNESMKLAEIMKFKLNLIDSEVLNILKSSDLTTNIDSYNTIDIIDRISNKLDEYEGFVILFRNIPIKLLRNFNRILLKVKKPAAVSFIDGPYITLFSVKPPKTGCIECFESRSLARLEDHAAYHKFVEQVGYSPSNDNLGIIPILNILTNLCMQEAYLFSLLGTSRFIGRTLNVFLPNFEIQVQDILRVPYCNGCGMIAKSKISEVNMSSRNVIDTLIDEALSNE